MKRQWFLAIGLVLVLLSFLSGCGATTPVGEVTLGQQQGIWITGTGEATVVPDVASLRVGVEAQEVDVAGAQAIATDTMSKVMDALSANGVDEEDIQTQHFSIDRVTQWDRIEEEETVVGYRVTNIVIAKIRDIDNTGAIIDAIVQAGGDLTRIYSIAFTVDDPSAYHQEAREKAMADAEVKAEQLADLAGVTLGKPTYISESIQAPPIIYPRAVYEEASAQAVTPISPGEMEISLTIQVAYAILN